MSSPRYSSGKSKILVFIKYLGLISFFAVVFAPLADLFYEAARSLFGVSGAWSDLAVPGGRRLSLLLRSVGLAAGVASSVAFLGVLCASVLVHWNTGGAARLRWMVVVPALLPPYVHAMAWDVFFLRLDVLARSAGFGGMQVYGWLAAWWVQVMALLPIAVGLSLLSFETVKPKLIEAALVHRPELEVLNRVVLPLAAPVILAGAGIVFVLSLADYTIPSLFLVNVYPLEIFAEFSAGSDPGRAMLLSLPLLLVTLLVMALVQLPIRRVVDASSGRAGRWTVSPIWNGWFGALQILSLLILTLQLAVPLVELIIKAGGWPAIFTAVSSASSEIIYTFIIALLVALFCLLTGLAPAMELNRGGKGSGIWWLLLVLPLAVPASLVGIGLITVWNQPALQHFYGSLLMPVMAGLARFAPLGALIIFAQLRRIDPLLLDAARVAQKTPWQAWTQVGLPLLRPGLVAAALVSFALTAGELGATLLVAPPGQATLTMRIYNYLHYGASGSVAGLCLLMLTAGLAAGAASVFAMTRSSSR
jgi:iron(III) transport system permease protein